MGAHSRVSPPTNGEDGGVPAADLHPRGATIAGPARLAAPKAFPGIRCVENDGSAAISEAVGLRGHGPDFADAPELGRGRKP